MSKFEFGFAQEDITPRRGLGLCGYFNLRPNRGAYDRLAVKAAAFRNGDSCCAVVSFDLCLFPASFVKRLEKALEEKKSPLAGKVLFCATHTHTGPFVTPIFGDDAAVDPVYVDSLAEKAVTAVENAYASLAEAELYTTTTECSTLAFNRRFIMKNGKTLTNPGKLNPDIDHPEGGTDPLIIIAEVRQEGRPVMMMANISNHTDTIGGDIVSADWPGRMEAEIQSALGYDIPVMTIIAPQGNINHFDVTTSCGQTGYEEARRIGKAYANVILSALYRMQKMEDTAITFKRRDFEAPYLQLTDEEYAEAKRVYEENKDTFMEEGRDFTSEDIAKGVPFVKKFFAERAIECRENPIKEKRVETQVAITFGSELAIVSLPAEPFVEIGYGIRRNSKYPKTMLAALGMGEIGYVGLPNNYGNGGYETSPSRGLADRTVGEAMIQGGIELLK